MEEKQKSEQFKNGLPNPRSGKVSTLRGKFESSSNTLLNLPPTSKEAPESTRSKTSGTTSRFNPGIKKAASFSFKDKSDFQLESTKRAFPFNKTKSKDFSASYSNINTTKKPNEGSSNATPSQPKNYMYPYRYNPSNIPKQPVALELRAQPRTLPKLRRGQSTQNSQQTTSTSNVVPSPTATSKPQSVGPKKEFTNSQRPPTVAVKSKPSSKSEPIVQPSKSFEIKNNDVPPKQPERTLDTPIQDPNENSPKIEPTKTFENQTPEETSQIVTEPAQEIPTEVSQTFTESPQSFNEVSVEPTKITENQTPEETSQIVTEPVQETPTEISQTKSEPITQLISEIPSPKPIPTEVPTKQTVTPPSASSSSNLSSFSETSVSKSFHISEQWKIKYDELEFEQLISEGSAGKIYLGYFFGTPVAIKQLFTLAPEQKHFVEREFSLLCDVKHPNIVQFLGIASNENELFLVTEYVEHGDLFDLLIFNSEKIQDRWDIKVKIAFQIAQACYYLHGKNIIHRDLKSQNVLVADSFKIKLCDLGLATVIENKKRLTVCGTDRWMAPEIATQEVYTNKVDLFSFGIVLTEIITCQPPAERKISEMLAFNEQHFLKSVPEDCPSEFSQLVIDCTKFDPNQRPSFKEVVPRLKQLLTQLEQ